MVLGWVASHRIRVLCLFFSSHATYSRGAWAISCPRWHRTLRLSALCSFNYYWSTELCSFYAGTLLPSGPAVINSKKIHGGMILKLLASTVELKENQLAKDSKIYTLEK